MNIILFSGIATVHAQSPSALVNADILEVYNGEHGNSIYWSSNSATLKAAVENAPNVRFRADWEAVIRVCVSRGGRAFCGPVIAWLNCPEDSQTGTAAAEVCGRGCEAWDAQHNRDCADGGAAWAEVPCGSEPGAVCSTSVRCESECVLEFELDGSLAYPVFREDDVMMLPGPSTAPACPTISIHAVSNGTHENNIYFHGDDSGSMAALLNGSTSTLDRLNRRQVVVNACLYRSGVLMGCQGFTTWPATGACGSEEYAQVSPTGTKVCGIGAPVSSRNLTSGLEYEAHRWWHFPIFQSGDTLKVITEGCETSPTPESPQPDPHLECTSQMLGLPNTTLNATHHQLGLTIPECANMWDFGIRVSTVPPNVLDGTCTQEGTQKWVCPTDLATGVRARQVKVVLEVVDASNTDLVYHTYVWNTRYSLDAVMVVSGLTTDVTGGRTHHGTSQLPTIKIPGRISLWDPETQLQRNSYALNEMARMTIYPERPFAEVLSLLRVQIADRTLHPVTTPIAHSDEEMGTGLQWEVRFVRPGRTNVTVHALIQTSGNGTRRLLESASGLEVVEMTATFNIEDENEDESWTFVIAGTVGGVCVVGVVAGVVLRGLHRRKTAPIPPRPPPYAPGFNPGEEMVDVVVK